MFDNSKRQNYGQFLSSLSLKSALSLRKERDNEILEMHNRIKRLLLEEERAAKKIEETKRKASLITSIQLEGQAKRKMC